MDCELCGRVNAELIGIKCARRKVCMPCIDWLVEQGFEQFGGV